MFHPIVVSEVPVVAWCHGMSADTDAGNSAEAWLLSGSRGQMQCHLCVFEKQSAPIVPILQLTCCLPFSVDFRLIVIGSQLV